ncbi:hypothetical protein D3C73_1342630 [compost metagenome]
MKSNVCSRDSGTVISPSAPAQPPETGFPVPLLFACLNGAASGGGENGIVCLKWRQGTSRMRKPGSFGRSLARGSSLFMPDCQLREPGRLPVCFRDWFSSWRSAG